MTISFKSMFLGLVCLSLYTHTQAQMLPVQRFRVLDAAHPKQITWVATVKIAENGDAVITRTANKPMSKDEHWGLIVVDELGKWKSELDFTAQNFSILTDASMDYWFVPINPNAGDVVKLSGTELNLACSCGENVAPMATVQQFACATQDFKNRCTTLTLTPTGTNAQTITTDKSAYLLVKAKKIVLQ